jgi:CDP-diacylglycerol pyrophosphatase
MIDYTTSSSLFCVSGTTSYISSHSIFRSESKMYFPKNRVWIWGSLLISNFERAAADSATENTLSSYQTWKPRKFLNNTLPEQLNTSTSISVSLSVPLSTSYLHVNTSSVASSTLVSSVPTVSTAITSGSSKLTTPTTTSHQTTASEFSSILSSDRSTFEFTQSSTTSSAANSPHNLTVTQSSTDKTSLFPSSTTISNTGASPTSSFTEIPTTLSQSSASSPTTTNLWSDTFIPPPKPFTWFDVPTSTIVDEPEKTREAGLLGGLFLALHANRKSLTDEKLKNEYIKNVKRTRDKTVSLLASLNIQGPEIPECSNPKRKRSDAQEHRFDGFHHKRSLLSSVVNVVKGAINDVAKIINCASSVVKGIVDAVEKSTPSLSEIENLTDTLAEIGKVLEKITEEKQTSTTETGSTTSASSSPTSSCSTSQTVTSCEVLCTETSTLGLRRRVETTTQLCSTSCKQIIGGCSLTATASTTTSQSTETPKRRCSPENLACNPNSFVAPPGYVPSCTGCVAVETGDQVSQSKLTSLVQPESPILVTSIVLIVYQAHVNSNSTYKQNKSALHIACIRCGRKKQLQSNQACSIKRPELRQQCLGLSAKRTVGFRFCCSRYPGKWSIPRRSTCGTPEAFWKLSAPSRCYKSLWMYCRDRHIRERSMAVTLLGRAIICRGGRMVQSNYFSARCFEHLGWRLCF